MRHHWATVVAVVCLQWQGSGYAAPNDAKSPKTVYRLDTREPTRIKAEGGFLPPEPNMDNPDHVSLWRHVHGTNPIGRNRKQSAYVFTSTTEKGAEELARPGQEYYLYRIRATPNFISARDTLGEENIEFFSAKTEYDALGGIRWDQVEGSTFLAIGKDTPTKKRTFKKNNDYDAKKYKMERAGGGEPRLAGFPEGHKAWSKGPWEEFKGKSLQQAALDFMNQNGKIVDWKGASPLLPNTGAFGAGNSIFYTDSLNPDIQMGSFADEKASGSAPGQEGEPGKEQEINEICRRADANCEGKARPGSEEEEKSGPKEEEKPGPKEEEKPGPKEEEKPGPKEEEKPGPKEEEKPGPKEEEKPEPKEEGKPVPQNPEGGKINVEEPGKLPKEVPIPKTPVEVLHPKLIKGLSFLQAAQLLTNVVDSATTRIKEAKPDTDHATLSSALTNTGTILVGIVNDTVPGFTDIEEHTAQLKSQLESISGKPPLDAAVQALEAYREYSAKVELTIFENYVPGVPEVMDNYKKEVAEFEQFKGTETKVQKAERMAKLVTKGTISTLNDVMRDWVPGYKEAQDSVREEGKRLSEDILRFHNNKESFWDVLKKGLTSPIKVVGDALHKVLQDYVPGEKQVEGLIFDHNEIDGKPDSSKPGSEQPAPEEVAPSDHQPPSSLSKMGREEWNNFIGNALDKEEAAECARGKVAEEKKKGGSEAADAWKAKLPELTKQCYEKQFFDWYGKPRRVRRALVA